MSLLQNTENMNDTDFKNVQFLLDDCSLLNAENKIITLMITTFLVSKSRLSFNHQYKLYQVFSSAVMLRNTRFNGSYIQGRFILEFQMHSKHTYLKCTWGQLKMDLRKIPFTLAKAYATFSALCDQPLNHLSRETKKGWIDCVLIGLVSSVLISLVLSKCALKCGFNCTWSVHVLRLLWSRNDPGHSNGRELKWTWDNISCLSHPKYIYQVFFKCSYNP